MKTRSDYIVKDVLKGIIKAIVLIPTILILVIVISQFQREIRFKTTKTRISDEGLYIVTDVGSYSLASSWDLHVFGENIIKCVSTNELTTGFFTGTSVKESYLFKPVSEGTAYISVTTFNHGILGDSKLYAVTVKKDLSISYKSYDAELLDIRSAADKTLTIGNKQFTLTKTSELQSYLIGNYVNETVFDSIYLEGLPKLEETYTTYYFDVDSGLVYLFDNKERSDIRLFQIDEHILPYFTDYLNVNSEQ